MRKKINVTFPFTMSRGFTLVELILYMGLLLMLIALTTTVFTTAINIQLEATALSSVEQDERYIIAKLNYDIERATAIVAPAARGSAASSMQLTIGGVTNTYAVSNNNLQLTANSVTNVLNGYDVSVSNFSVTRYGNVGGTEDTLNISFTLTSKTRKNTGYETKNVSTTFALRHH